MRVGKKDLGENMVAMLDAIKFWKIICIPLVFYIKVSTQIYEWLPLYDA